MPDPVLSAEEILDPRTALGTAIRRQRTRLALSLEDLAGYTGLSKSAISYIESGSFAVRLTSIDRIAKAIGDTSGRLQWLSSLTRTPLPVRRQLAKLVSKSQSCPPQKTPSSTTTPSAGSPPTAASSLPGSFTSSPPARTDWSVVEANITEHSASLARIDLRAVRRGGDSIPVAAPKSPPAPQPLAATGTKAAHEKKYG